MSIDLVTTKEDCDWLPNIDPSKMIKWSGCPVNLRNSPVHLLEKLSGAGETG